MIRRILAAALFIALPAMAQNPLTGSGQAFPTKPITLINPFEAGGPTDTQLRKLAEIAARHLGKPVVLETKPGAGGMLGPVSMAKTAKPDGYVLSQLAIGAFRIPHMEKVDWNPLKDFTYIIGLTGYEFGVLVKGDSQFKTLKDLIDYARANPGKLSYASVGYGTSTHLLMEEMSLKAGIQLLHVPYKVTAGTLPALLGGHVMAMCGSSGTFGKLADSGSVRLLASFGEQRTKWKAPTAKELGLDVVTYSPYGIVGPAGMDPKVVKILHDAFKKALDDPEHMKLLAQLSQVYWYKSSEDYAKWAAETFRSERALMVELGLAK
jgi:tripartite-type tricarboxylate transporter receptor subunit TctC